MRKEIMQSTAQIVSSYVATNKIDPDDIMKLIARVWATLEAAIEHPDDEPRSDAMRVPAVPVDESVTKDFIICLEDGKKFKSLKRHIWEAYGLSPKEYRKKWGLPGDYPMTAPGYAEKRSIMAKKMGLGRNVSRVKAAA